MDERNDIDTTENRLQQNDTLENDRPTGSIDSEDGTRPISTYRLDGSHEEVEGPHTTEDADNVDEEVSTEAEATDAETADGESEDSGSDESDKGKKSKKKRKPGMIRWGYLAPRAAVLALAISLVWVLLNPILRIALIQAGQAAVGAKVEIESLSTSMTDTSIELRGIAVADPDHEMKNLFEIDQMKLDLNAIDLLKKKLVVTDAVISGVRLSTERTTSGLLEEFEEEAEEPVEEEASESVMPEWVAGQLDSIQENAEAQLERFESIKLAEQLSADWPKAYEDLRTRADSIQARALQLKQLYEQRQGVRNDPQAALQLVGQAGGELGTLNTEAQEILRRLEELKQRFEQDKQKVIELGRADLAELNQMATEAGIGPRELTEMLIGDMIVKRVKNAATWVAYIKKLIPDKEKSLAKAQKERVTGVNVEFPISDHKPPLLIERMAIDGMLPLAGVDYGFSGEIRDITSDPSHLGRPIECEMKLEGPAACNMHLTVDATGDVLRQHLVVSCPNLQLEKQTLGRADRLAIDVAPGRMEIGADIVVEDDEVFGTIITKQNGAKLTMATREDTVIGRWNPRLQQLVDSIRSIDTRVDLTGTVKKPKVAIESNLGNSLATGLRTAVTAELTARRDQLIQLTQEKINGQLTSLDRFVAEKRAEIENRIRLDEAKIGPIARVLNGDGGQGLVNQLIGGVGGQLQNQAMGAINGAAGGAVQNVINGAAGGLMNRLPGMGTNHAAPQGGRTVPNHTSGAQSGIPGMPSGLPGLQNAIPGLPSGIPGLQTPAGPQNATPATGSPYYGGPTGGATPYQPQPQAGYAPPVQQPPVAPANTPAVSTPSWRTGNLIPAGGLIPR